MSYSSNSDLPSAVKDALPSDAQSVFRSVVNEAIADGDAEGSALDQGWGVVKQIWKKGEGGQWVKKSTGLDAEARIAKLDDSLGLVFGWAIVCKINGEPYYDLNVDIDTMKRVPEHIPEDAMLKASMDFMLSPRVGNEMHDGPDSGMYVFAWPMTSEIAKAMGIETNKTGLMIAYKPTPEVYKKFKDGTYTGFSIEGSRVRSQEIEE